MDYTTSENIVKLDEVSAHLFHRVSHAAITKWLENFDEEDRENALQLLGFMNFFTTDRIYTSLKHSLDKIVQASPKKCKIRILAVRKMSNDMEGITGGQSGQMISYYAKKVAESFEKDKIKIIEENDLQQLYKKHRECLKYKIVLIDDIFGSGDTLISYYQHIKEYISPYWTKVALSVAYISNVEDRIIKANIDIYGERIIPVFDAIEQADYKGREIARKYYELARKYGERLYVAEEGNITPMGYKDSKALVGFEYGIPNNTLPIIWASERESGTGQPWYPIFERNIQDRLDRKRRCKNDIVRWFCAARKRGLVLQNTGKNISSMNEDVLRLYLILSMVEKLKDAIIITNYLCINADVYENSIEMAQENGYLDSTQNLTEKARMALSAIEGMRKSTNGIDVLKICDNIYLPNV